MRGLHAWCVLGGLAVGACIDIPPCQGPPIDAFIDAACGANPLDCDDDGWVAEARNLAAHDCDDRDPTRYPGVRDDDEMPPEPEVDEDCIPDGTGDRIFEVTGDEAGWTSGALRIEFGTQTR